MSRVSVTETQQSVPGNSRTPVLEARGLVKHYGQVVAMDGADFDLYPGEILAVIGDNGAGKSTLIKALSGAVVPDSGKIFLNGNEVKLRTPLDARGYGIETVHQSLAVAPALNIVDNMFMGREIRKGGFMGKYLRMLDKKKMLADATVYMQDLEFRIQSMKQPVETLSGGQRQGVAVARAAAFAQNVIILDEPTAALGVKESGMVLELIQKVRERGLPVILISHNMPHVFEIADRIHVHRMGKRTAIVKPNDYSMSDVVAIMTGALEVEQEKN